MSEITRHDPLELLRPPQSEPLGAAFTSYTFSSRFFEETVLAGLLPIEPDPDEEPRRFLDQGRYQLQRTPVVAIIDPHRYDGGRRLPYDLILADSARTFHPKVSLVLYDDHARLIVGSGNLTPGGLGENAELGVLLPLDYVADARLIRDAVRFFEACGARGESWQRFSDQYRLLATGEGAPRGADAPALLESTTAGPLLERFLKRIPADARVHSLGVMAPFHQEDDAPPEVAVIERAVSLLGNRLARGFEVHVGFAWEGNPLTPTTTDVADPDAHLGELWARRTGGAVHDTVSWFLLARRGSWNFVCEGPRAPQQYSKRSLRADVAAGVAWPVGTVRAAGPANLVARLAQQFQVRAFVFPEVRREDGRTYRRPLHGKLLCVETTEGGAAKTHLLLGSPNASAAALLLPKGNVEAAIHLVVRGRHQLSSLAPELVPCPLSQLALCERVYQPISANPGRWVEDAYFDAEAKTLTIVLRSGCPRLRIVYPRSAHALVLHDGPTPSSIVVPDFDLEPDCAELLVEEGGRSGRVPIRVVNVAALPTMGPETAPSLEELIALCTGRYVHPTQTPGRTGDASSVELATEGAWSDELGPRDFFRAFFARAQELERVGSSLGAFQMLLDGPTGLRALADRLLDAAERGARGRGEIWTYGQELSRALLGVRFEEDAVGLEKQARLAEFVKSFRERLRPLQPKGPWVRRLSRFYEGVA